MSTLATPVIARERAVAAVCAGAALALGVFAALASNEWTGTAAMVLVIAVAAWTLPLDWVVLAIAALMPLQLYFNLPGSSFALRAAVVLVFAAALRVVIQGVRWQGWMLPAIVFLLAAAVGALTAPNRYTAFRGIYEWLPIFGSALVAGQVVKSSGIRNRLVGFLIGAGILEAMLGLAQYAVGLDAVVELLRLPVSRWFYQPNLLAERLGDLSFNWVIFDRAAPFGTFINGIDFAVFVASILSLVLALLLFGREQLGERWMLVLLGGAAIMGMAVLLTFKGSGGIALAGGIATVLVLGTLGRSRIQLTARVVALAVLLLLAVIILAVSFSDLLGQRLAFLVLREQGGFGTAGRLEIWQSLVQVFMQRPLFGFGLDNATLFTEPMRTLRDGIVAYNSTTPESGYVAALVETGLVGFGALMTLFGVTLVHGWRRMAYGTDAGRPQVVSTGDASPLPNPAPGYVGATLVVARPGAVMIGILAAIVALLMGNLTVTGFTTHQNGMLLGLLIGTVFAEWNPR